jgi:hypothetical protein
MCEGRTESKAVLKKGMYLPIGAIEHKYFSFMVYLTVLSVAQTKKC